MKNEHTEKYLMFFSMRISKLLDRRTLKTGISCPFLYDLSARLTLFIGGA
jgi:hypothetical protein